MISLPKLECRQVVKEKKRNPKGEGIKKKGKKKGYVAISALNMIISLSPNSLIHFFMEPLIREVLIILYSINS